MILRPAKAGPSSHSKGPRNKGKTLVRVTRQKLGDADLLEKARKYEELKEVCRKRPDPEPRSPLFFEFSERSGRSSRDASHFPIDDA